MAGRRKKDAMIEDGNWDPSGATVLAVHDHPRALDRQAWNALLQASPDANPFLRHELLCALHDSGSAVSSTGWQPQFLSLTHQGELVGACPLYLKSHSYGEYVFDWAWARAYQEHGLDYYPKLLGAVPFTPVPGARLLVREDRWRAPLLQAVETLARRQSLSSAHLLFLSPSDRDAARESGWMLRQGVQFHWHNRAPRPYADFADFMSTLQRDKRKKILQERRYVAEAGVNFRIRVGPDIGEADWDFFYRCYTRTYREHHSTPYLSRSFFREVAATLPEHWALFVAERAGVPIGCALLALDPVRRHAYGRYWGALEPVRCLHFEACYYQPLQWCIEQGYVRFEGGAQGEHKMARGLLPVPTWSAHWLADARFADAVARFLEREGAGMEAYLDELREHAPYRPGESLPTLAGRSGPDAEATT